MNKRLKEIFGVLITLSLIIIFVVYCGKILSPNFIGDAFNTINTFHKQPKDSIDVMVYGSSHAWKGFDTKEFTDKYGISSYNYGCNWQQINTTELFLKDSLITQTPKVVVIESLYVNSVLIDRELNGEIYYTNAITNSLAKKEYLNQCFNGKVTRYISYYVPLVAFHENWTSINLWNFKNPTDDYDFMGNRGYLTSNKVTQVELSDYTSFKQNELSEDAIKVLDDIVNTCKNKGIKVIFYTAPYQGEYNYFNAMQAYANEHGCAYLNLFDLPPEYKIDGATDFQDPGHLNNSGAKKVANYIGKYIIDNYDFY